MKHWTKQAEARLAQYLRIRVSCEQLSEWEAEELRDDLRRHVYEEAESMEGESIGLMQIEHLIGKMDGGRPVDVLAPPPARTWPGAVASFFLWVFGVILPVGVLGFEMFSGACSAVLFNPIPTWWHILAIAAVPAVNVCCLRGILAKRPRCWVLGLGFPSPYPCSMACCFSP